jgi:hypothetical protein
MCLTQDHDHEPARRRHAIHFVALAEQAAPELLGPGQAAWLDRLDSEVGNFRAGLEYLIATGDAQHAQRLAGKLWPFWLHRCYWTEGSQFLNRVLAIDGADTRTVWRANALMGLSYLTEANVTTTQRNRYFYRLLSFSARSETTRDWLDRSFVWEPWQDGAVKKVSPATPFKRQST